MPTQTPPPTETPASSQTLSRGLTALEFIASSSGPVSMAQIAESLGVHRSVAYRLVKTLQAHGLVAVASDGRFLPGLRLAALAQGVESTLRSAAAPVLHRLRDQTRATAFLVVAGGGECLTLDSLEWSEDGAVLSHKPGTRHSLEVGAPGIAVMSGVSPEEWASYEPGLPYRPEAVTARERGYALSHDEVIDGLSACASPIPLAHGLPAAVAIVYLSSRTLSESEISAVRTAAEEISRRLGSRKATS